MVTVAVAVVTALEALTAAFGGWGGPGFGWGGPFGFYPPAPYGAALGSCACGPYGCFCAPDYTYLVQVS